VGGDQAIRGYVHTNMPRLVSIGKKKGDRQRKHSQLQLKLSSSKKKGVKDLVVLKINAESMPIFKLVISSIPLKDMPILIA
jgi:hypothetical protein